MCSVSCVAQFTSSWKHLVQSFPLIYIEFCVFKLFEGYNICNLDQLHAVEAAL